MNPFRSWLGALNFLVLQWLWIRLEQQIDRQPAGTHLGVQLYRDVHMRWGVIGWIVPMTGWWTSYIRFWGWSR